MGKTIKRADIKVGDTIAVSRTVTVESVRHENDRERPLSIIYPKGASTFALTDDQAVELVESGVAIPLGAILIQWKHGPTAGRVFAYRDSVDHKWRDTYLEENWTTDELEEAIRANEGFLEYTPGSLQIVRSTLTPRLASGGITLSASDKATLGRAGGYVLGNAVVAVP